MTTLICEGIISAHKARVPSQTTQAVQNEGTWHLNYNIVYNRYRSRGGGTSHLFLRHVCRLRGSRVDELHSVRDTLRQDETVDVSELLRQALRQQDQVILADRYQGDQIGVVEVEDVGVVVCRHQLFAVLHLVMTGRFGKSTPACTHK